MAARCNFCNRAFSSSQGVRAHLKSCSTYRNNKNPIEPRHVKTPKLPIEVLPEAAIHNQANSISQSYVEGGNDLMNLGAEKHQHWQKEQVKQMEEELERFRLQEEYEREKLRQEEITDRRRQEEKRRRREVIQDVKGSVIDRHYLWNDVPTEVKSETKLEIERVLGALPVLELPKHELIEISEGIREKLYKTYFKAVEVEKSNRKEVISMPKRRIYSGYFYCPNCDADFKVEQEEEDELICDDCGTKLEKDEEDNDE